MRRLWPFAFFLLLGLLDTGSSFGQAVPKKIVFISPVGSAPPPATTSPIFSVPSGVTIGVTAGPGAVSGTVYVADPNNNQVVAFAPSGTPLIFHVLTCPAGVHGCFGNSTWTLNSPTFVAAASNGNVWISDTGNDVVVQIDPTGKVVQFAGSGPNGTVFGCFLGIGCPANPNAGQGNGQFFGPGPLAVDGSDNLYVADAAGDLALNRDGPALGNVRIEKFNKNGAFLTSWGSFCVLNDNGTQFSGSCNISAPGAALGDGQFAWITGIAVDGQGAVYVTDAEDNRVQKFTPTGRLLLKWGGRPKGAADGQFQTPGGIAVDLDQTIYVTDIANNRIQEFTTSGAFLAKAGSMGSGEAQFTRPFGIASVPPGVALGCLFGPTPSDCVHGLVVSEAGGGNTRVQFLAGRTDTDLDGITDEIDLQSGGASASFSDAALGFTTFGNIVSAGDQTFAIYNVETPAAADQIRVRAESFGGLQPLNLLVCGVMSTTVPAGGQPNFHCSTPTVEAELGPVGFQVTGSDGTAASGTLPTGGSVSYDSTTSTIKDNAGSIQVTVGGRTNTLLPGQTAYADQTAPTTATVSANPNRWFHGTTVVTLRATDNQNGSGVNNISYSLSGAQPGSGTVTGSTTTVPLLAEGVTTMTFFATDKAGNQEVPKSVTVKIDKTPPILRCTATPAILKTTGNLEKVNLSVTVDDPLSGPAGFVLTSIGNNEQPPKEHPEHGRQDVQGFTQGKASTSGEVRAEITHAKERIYTFTYTGMDQAGNQETCTANVKVIRSREGAESPRKAADAGEGGR